MHAQDAREHEPGTAMGGRGWDGMETGAIRVIWGSDDPGDCYVTVPIVDSPGEFLAVFQDGSFTRWTPCDAEPDRVPPRIGGPTGRHRLA